MTLLNPMNSGVSAARRLSYLIGPATVLALLGPFLVTPVALAAEQIGAVVQPEYQGAVAVPDGAGSGHPIQYRDKVHALDTVMTSEAGTTSIEFLDRTRLDVGAGATLRLDSFVYDPASTVGAGEMSFAVGAFRYVGGQMTTEENVQLRTPTATMVIRGTELVIYVWPDGRSEINVVSGAVEVSPCGASGAALLAMSGMRVTVQPDCAIKRARLRPLQLGMAALSLPVEKDVDGGDSGTPEKDRRGDPPESGGKVEGDGGSKSEPASKSGTSTGFSG